MDEHNYFSLASRSVHREYTASEGNAFHAIYSPQAKGSCLGGAFFAKPLRRPLKFNSEHLEPRFLF